MKSSTPGDEQTTAAATESAAGNVNTDMSRRHFIQGAALAAAASALPPAIALSAGGPTPETPTESYDVVIIGSGISGAIVAKRLAKLSPKATILILEAGTGGLNDRTREISNYFSDLNKFPESPFDQNI